MLTYIEPYTLTVTSCERHNLLKTSLESFSKYADVPPIETIIIEDSNLDKPDWLDSLSGLGKITWLKNGFRKGQTYSLDKVYSEVKTPFIFATEDDWEFFRTGFILESMKILDSNAEISTVSLRGPSEHPEIFIPEFGYKIRQKDWNGWGGISWNPGMRRLSDWQRIGSFGKHVPYNLKCQEHGISLLYRKLGYYMGSLPAACKHIGAEDKVWNKPIKNAKILVAFQVCHKYHVGNLAHENFDKHKFYQPIDQISACRETWAKDLQACGVDYKFFYGNPTSPVNPFNDEILLDVPDDYRSLPKKLKAICRWALDHGYEYVFKCDDDTFVWIKRLLDSDFFKYDCVGYNWGGFVGGFACWLSKKAMETIAHAPDTDETADDVWVGKVLKHADISIHHDPRYHPNNENKFVKLENIPLAHSYIAIHACDADTIRELYDRKTILSDEPISDKTGFLTSDEKSFDDEVNDIMGGLEL